MNSVNVVVYATVKKIEKILVTGADGFIGSHLLEFLVNKNFNVRALSIYNSFFDLDARISIIGGFPLCPVEPPKIKS